MNTPEKCYTNAPIAEAVVAYKHEGDCPFCNAKVEPAIIQKNTVRRDECKCPACSKTIYRCRNPNCDHYAKSKAIWSDELCPVCAEGASEAAKGVYEAAGKVAKGSVEVLKAAAPAVAVVLPILLKMERDK